MNVGCHDFVNAMVKQSPGLRVIYKEALEYWAPDEPPITTLLAEFAQRIVVDLNEVKTEINQWLFRLIETAMKSGDSELTTAAGTGLIEAMVAKSFRDEHLWREISSMFGAHSRKYAEASDRVEKRWQGETSTR